MTVQWHPEVLPGKSGCVAAHEASEPPVAAEETWVLHGWCLALLPLPGKHFPLSQAGKGMVLL